MGINDKRMFWPIFRDAWEASFTKRNVLSAFEKTGIWPFKPSRTIKEIQKASPSTLIPSKLPPLPIRTPQNARSIRRLCKASPSITNRAILERAALRLATEVEIQKHINKGLGVALRMEKKRRKPGVRLNLKGEEVTGIRTLPRTRAYRSLEFRNRFEAPKPYLIESLAQAIPITSGRGRRIGVHRHSASQTLKTQLPAHIGNSIPSHGFQPSLFAPLSFLEPALPLGDTLLYYIRPLHHPRLSQCSHPFQIL